MSKLHAETGKPDHQSPDSETKNRLVSTSAWLVYVIIVFEIIFMISPAAFYYYSVYGLPLNLLTEHAATSWLVQYVLPHFSAHDSSLGNFMIMVSWPLIILGVLMFCWGFVQIYYTKFTGGGAVTGGLYRYIRHPQYTALAIVGLGTTLFWSRFLVLIAFVTMMFLYLALARAEEARCLRQFGAGYKQYLDKTGRFLPLSIENRLPRVPSSAAALFVTYIIVLTGSITAGFGLRHHVIARMNVIELPAGEHEVLAIGVAPTSDERMQAALSLAESYLPPAADLLLYVVPASWAIPELGIRPVGGYNNSAGAELAHPTMHGNVPEYDGTGFSVLVTDPAYRSQHARGLANIISMNPRFNLVVDIETGEVNMLTNLPRGKWAGIPVPAY